MCDESSSRSDNPAELLFLGRGGRSTFWIIQLQDSFNQSVLLEHQTSASVTSHNDCRITFTLNNKHISDPETDFYLLKFYRNWFFFLENQYLIITVGVCFDLGTYLVKHVDTLSSPHFSVAAFIFFFFFCLTNDDLRGCTRVTVHMQQARCSSRPESCLCPHGDSKSNIHSSTTSWGKYDTSISIFTQYLWSIVKIRSICEENKILFFLYLLDLRRTTQSAAYQQCDGRRTLIIYLSITV